MVATDTVVGIVGAVVLVAVMAGVFVYEWNNTEGDGALSVAEQREHFEEDYAGLSATQDIDGDGIQNFNDTDLDGDKINNTEDKDLAVIVSVSGSVPASNTAMPGQPFTLQFYVGNGTEHLGGTLTYTRPTAAPTPVLAATITGPGGFSANAQSTTSGSTVTLKFDSMDAMPAGNYTLTVSQAPVAGPLGFSQAAAISGTIDLHYPMPMVEPHGHDAEK